VHFTQRFCDIVVPLRLVDGAEILSLISMTSVFGTPVVVTYLR
jgi:hypothetical protein